MGYYNPNKSKIQHKNLKKPCNTTDGDQDTTKELYFCYQNNSTQAVFTFDQSLQVGGYGINSWKGYDWYLDSNRDITGISKIDNNWLLMAEQAAQAAKTDCVVCMGARPVLQVVPSALDHKCLADVMNNTTPSTNCSFWDEVYPLTSDEKKKPIFSNKVAAGNFSCINRTGEGSKMSKLDSTQCHSVLTVDINFRQTKM